MKNKLILTVIAFIIINITNAYSQNHNIGQLKFVLNGQDSTCINDTIADFKGPLEPTIGFQWGNEPSACKAIYANQNCVIKDFLFDNNNQSEANAAQEGAYLMISDYKFFTASLGDTSLCSSHSMTWEPNMLVAWKINPTLQRGDKSGLIGASPNASKNKEARVLARVKLNLFYYI